MVKKVTFVGFRGSDGLYRPSGSAPASSSGIKWLC